MPIRLLIIAGPELGRAYELSPGKSLLIGRGEDCDIQVLDSSVSRQHCQVVVQAGRAMIEDLNSTWGTIVNAQKIGRHLLKPNDLLTLGETVLRFEVIADPAAVTWEPPASRIPAKRPAPPRPETAERPERAERPARPEPRPVAKRRIPRPPRERRELPSRRFPANRRESHHVATRTLVGAAIGAGVGALVLVLLAVLGVFDGPETSRENATSLADSNVSSEPLAEEPKQGAASPANPVPRVAKSRPPAQAGGQGPGRPQNQPRRPFARPRRDDEIAKTPAVPPQGPPRRGMESPVAPRPRPNPPAGQSGVQLTLRKSLRQQEMGTFISECAITPDLKLVIASAADDVFSTNSDLELSKHGTVTVFDARTGQKSILKVDDRRVDFLNLSPDGKMLALGTYDETQLWDPLAKKRIAVLAGDLPFGFDPTGKLLANRKGKAITIWDVSSRKIVATLTGHSDYPTAAAFSPDGKILASGGADQTIKLWDVQTARILASWTAHDDMINSLAFSRDGKWLASGSDDDRLKLWNAETRKLAASSQHTGDVFDVQFAPDDKFLVAGGMGDIQTAIRIYEPQGLRVLAESDGHMINSLFLSADGSTLVLGGLNLELWDVTVP